MKNNRFGKLFNKIHSSIIFLLLLFVSVAFDGAVIYGMNGSSLVGKEKYIYQLKQDMGTDIHIRYNLTSFSLASRLSLMSPINEYNNYRIKEIGRNVSYVLNENFTVNYEEQSFECAYSCFEDKYSDALTVSRFLLTNGSFADFENKDLVYVSSDFLANIRGLKAKDAIGQKIKLSLKEEKEFTIGGVIRNNQSGEAGLHFKTLFNGSYVLFNRALLTEYGFTDLMFSATDDMFSEDYAEFISAYNKSYLSFNDARMKISSFNSDKEQIVKNYSSPRYKKTEIEDRYAFLTVLTIVVVSLIYLLILIFYDFKKVRLYVKIPACGILTAFHFLGTFYLAKQMKKGLFVSKLSLTMFIGFMIVSLISYIFIFLLFNLVKKQKGGEKNNG